MPRLQTRLSLTLSILGVGAWVVCCGLVEPEPAAHDASIPVDAGPPTCAACLVSECTALYTQCETSSACYGSYQCLFDEQQVQGECGCTQPGTPDPLFVLFRCVHEAGCGQGACASACEHDDGGPDGSFLRLTACTTALASFCNLGSGSGSAPPVSSTAQCNACTASHCGAFAGACGAGSACESYLTCLAGCLDSSCVSDCSAGQEDGLGAADALDVCIGSTCETACGF